MKPTIFASQLLTPSGWKQSVRLHVTDGRIGKIEENVPPQPGDERHGVILPALPNLHSHAFQRGMAGLAEMRGGQGDDFWSWRDTMYRFAARMTPAQLEAVAAMAYMEMLEGGFGRVGEFHYLHHDTNGQSFANPAEMSVRIAVAAADTGISLTLLPVFYAHSGFGGKVPQDHQKRFIHDIDAYARLFERCSSVVSALPGGRIGVTPHSLRAVTPDELGQLHQLAKASATAPTHIHIAEQIGEVRDCVAWSGARPVRWLLDHMPVDAGWCLVHATQVDDGELRGMAESGAVVGLCPVTEANLGDGIFPAHEFLAMGGRCGVGSDSNVYIDAAAEVSLLEYGQRLARCTRNVLADGPGRSTGVSLFQRLQAGGSIALGGSAEALVPGAAADMLSLAVDSPALVGRQGDALVDSWIFAGAGRAVDCVWVQGRKLVEGGRHFARDRICRVYRQAMEELCA